MSERGGKRGGVEFKKIVRKGLTRVFPKDEMSESTTHHHLELKFDS